MDNERTDPMTMTQEAMIKEASGLASGLYMASISRVYAEGMDTGAMKTRIRALAKECDQRGGPKRAGLSEETWSYTGGDEPFYLVPAGPKPCNPDGSLRL